MHRLTAVSGLCSAVRPPFPMCGAAAFGNRPHFGKSTSRILGQTYSLNSHRSCRDIYNIPFRAAQHNWNSIVLSIGDSATLGHKVIISKGACLLNLCVPFHCLSTVHIHISSHFTIVFGGWPPPIVIAQLMWEGQQMPWCGCALNCSFSFMRLPDNNGPGFMYYLLVTILVFLSY